MANYKLSRELKKRMEKELRQYWDNVHKLEQLKKEIIEETASGDGQPRGNITSDTTAQKALKLISTRSIALLSERILYVTKTINRLKPFEQDIFNLIFKENKDWLYCETMKGVSKTTYYNIMNKSIYYLAEEWRRNMILKIAMENNQNVMTLYNIYAIILICNKFFIFLSLYFGRNRLLS